MEYYSSLAKRRRQEGISSSSSSAAIAKATAAATEEADLVVINEQVEGEGGPTTTNEQNNEGDHDTKNNMQVVDEDNDDNEDNDTDYEEEDEKDNNSAITTTGNDNNSDTSTKSSNNNMQVPPIRDGNILTYPISNLRTYLICTLCSGYYSKPYTVVDCLHTFCYRCLILFFRQGMRCCPTCNTKLSPDPFNITSSVQSREIIQDHTLQDVVDKIFPWHRTKDEENERKFYKCRGIDMKPEYDTGKDDDDVVVAKSRNDVGKQSHIEIQLQPDDIHPSSEKKHQQLPHLQSSSSSTLLYLSCRTKVTTIKKYLQHKFGLNECSTLSSSLSSSSSSLPSSIELLCNGNVLLDDEDLTYIVRTYWSSLCHLSNEVLTLTYRLGDNAGESK